MCICLCLHPPDQICNVSKLCLDEMEGGEFVVQGVHLVLLLCSRLCNVCDRNCVVLSQQFGAWSKAEQRVTRWTLGCFLLQQDVLGFMYAGNTSL